MSEKIKAGKPIVGTLVYFSQTLRQGRSIPQDYRTTIIERRGSITIRVEVTFDTTHRDQCSGTIDSLAGGAFHTLLKMRVEDMGFCLSYHTMDIASRGQILRDGDQFGVRVYTMMLALAQRGFDILGE